MSAREERTTLSIRNTVLMPVAAKHRKHDPRGDKLSLAATAELALRTLEAKLEGRLVEVDRAQLSEIEKAIQSSPSPMLSAPGVKEQVSTPVMIVEGALQALLLWLQGKLSEPGVATAYAKQRVNELILDWFPRILATAVGEATRRNVEATVTETEDKMIQIEIVDLATGESLLPTSREASVTGAVSDGKIYASVPGAGVARAAQA